MTRRLVALTGPAGSGKSTAARILERHGFRRLRFAGALKAMLAALLREAGMSADEIAAAIDGATKDAPCAALAGRTPRHALQTLGTEWGREQIADGLWLGIVRRQIAASRRPVVIDDCRFPNEAALVRELGGVVVGLHGRGGLFGLSGGHASEAGVLADRTIDNSGDVAELAHRLAEMIGARCCE